MSANIIAPDAFSSLNQMSIDVLLSESVTSINDGDYNGASEILENVLQRDPEKAAGWLLLGVIAEKKGNLDLAEVLLKKAILLKTDFYKAYLLLIDIYIKSGRIKEAKEIYQYIAQKEKARKIPEFYAGLWMIERLEGYYIGAKKYLKEYLKLAAKPVYSGQLAQPITEKSILEYTILANCDVEPILDDATREKKNLQKFLDLANKLIKSGKSVKGLPSSTPNLFFQMAYYNDNPRPYLEKAAELYRKVFPDLCWTSPHCQGKRLIVKGKKIKLGIVSTHIDCLHAVGYCFAPLVKYLPRGVFEITLFKIQTNTDKSVSDIKGWLGELTSVLLPNDVKLSRESIASHAVDILWYTDLIMVEHSTMLAHSRLAPVQCVSAGHPVTSGLSTIDYFLSSRLQESSEAQENYTEKLILMPCFPVIYPEFHLDKNTLTKKDIGLPEKGRLYFCCQTPFKINPAMDEVFRKILEKDEEAIILFSYGGTHYAEQLRARLEKSLGKELVSRCCIISRLGQNEFLVVLDLVDVILDSFPFGGGNTTLQSFAVNQPMVHLASADLRRSGTGGAMKMVGIQELIANTKEDYVEIALKLSKDKAYRESMRQKVKDNKHLIFNQDDTIKNAHVKLFQDLYYQHNLEEYF